MFVPPVCLLGLSLFRKNCSAGLGPANATNILLFAFKEKGTLRSICMRMGRASSEMLLAPSKAAGLAGRPAFVTAPAPAPRSTARRAHGAGPRSSGQTCTQSKPEMWGVAAGVGLNSPKGATQLHVSSSCRRFILWSKRRFVSRQGAKPLA